MDTDSTISCVSRSRTQVENCSFDVDLVALLLIRSHYLIPKSRLRRDLACQMGGSEIDTAMGLHPHPGICFGTPTIGVVAHHPP